jgi:hypothetical protein
MLRPTLIALVISPCLFYVLGVVEYCEIICHISLKYFVCLSEMQCVFPSQVEKRARVTTSHTCPAPGHVLKATDKHPEFGHQSFAIITRVN